MLIYFELIQLQIKTKKIYSPIKIKKIPNTNTKIIIPNNNYWKDIHQTEFSSNNKDDITKPTENTNEYILKTQYFMFIETIAKQISSIVLKDEPIILIKEKYKAYKILITNIFLTPEIKQQIQTIFEKVQKHYAALTKFSRIIQKYLQNKPNNQSNQHKITTDLSLTPLNPTHKHTFIVYENTNSYLFSITDLINIINTAITNAPDFFENPLHPKNPYTNLPLTNTTLQAFFYKLHKIYYPIPSILEKYYKCQFNIKWFSIQNQMEIRDIAIKNFVNNSPATVIHQEILDMIDDYFYNPQTDNNIEIDKEFPIHQLINIMRPYLYIFLMGEYHINGSEKQTQAKRVFRKAKQIFINYNPRFGERMPPSPQPSPRQLQKKNKQKSKKKRKFNQCSQEMSESQPTTTFIFKPLNITNGTPEEFPSPTFIFNQPNNNDKNIIKKANKMPKFFDEHPKFSMNDIEIYLQDISKLKQLQPIRRPRSPPRPIYINFDTEDELSETDP